MWSWVTQQQSIERGVNGCVAGHKVVVTWLFISKASFVQKTTTTKKGKGTKLGVFDLITI